MPAAKGKESALLEAAAEGEVAEVNRLLAPGVKVNAKDNEGQTAWDYAKDSKVKELFKKAKSR